MNNYLINGKKLGFSSKDINQVIMEVLTSYMPIKPTTCGLTGKPILTNPRVVLIDGDVQNFLFSNLVITTQETKYAESFLHEITVNITPTKYENGKSISIRLWKSDDFGFLQEQNLKAIRKVCSDTEETNPFQLFLDLIYNGVKGIISVSVVKKSVNDVCYTEADTVHYQDICRYRINNDTNIVSPIK